MSGNKKLKGFDKVLARLAKIETVFGSDIYVSYSHEYVWQANQFGHVLIGLLLTLVLTWLTCSATAALLIVVAIYILKELIDFLIAIRLVEGVFPLSKREAALDGIVDTLFVVGGALFAAAAAPRSTMCELFRQDETPSTEPSPAVVERSWYEEFGSWLVLFVFVALVLHFFVTRHYYLKRKRKFDKSGMPHYVRLATFPDNFDLNRAERSALVDQILAFARGEKTVTQLIITGPPRSGRTTLAMSIGGEATNILRQVRYLSATRLAEKTRATFEIESAIRQPYQVAEADLILIDETAPQILSTDDPAATRWALDTLVDTRWHATPTTVFQRPVALRSKDGSDLAPKVPADAEPRQSLPQLVWVTNDVSAASSLRQALEAKFPTVAVTVITLKGPLRRAMRLEG